MITLPILSDYQQSLLSDIYDSTLLAIPHYKYYPEMLPFVGSHYQRLNKKILVIGESHYWDADSDAHFDVDAWYNGEARQHMTKINADYIFTRGVVSQGHHRHYGFKAAAIFQRVEAALADCLQLPRNYPTDNYFRYAAFYNYFQRPAGHKVSLAAKENDRKVAFSHLLELISILQPTHLAFVSKLAYRTFLQELSNAEKASVGTHYFGCPHPGSSWWNRKQRFRDASQQVHRMKGREWFQHNIGPLELI